MTDSYADPAARLVSDVLLDAFERVHEEVPQILKDLSVEDVLWRPDPEANSIGWLIWHLARVQDDHLVGVSTALERPTQQAWSRWREEFGLPYEPDAIGYGQSSDEVGGFALTDPSLLSRYHEDVHALTMEVVESMTADDYEAVVDKAWNPPVTAAARLVSVVNDITAHTGQAAYIKRLRQRATG